jgi:hypothetical protein
VAGPDRTEQILSRHLDGDFRVSPLADAPVSRAQIAAIGARFGVRYPDALCDHVCGRFPGMFVEVKETVWPRPKPYSVGPFWKMLYAVHTYTSAPTSEPWMRLDVAAEEFRERSGLEAAPILRVAGDADVYCVDTRGKIVQWRHEEDTLEPVDLDYWGLLDREIRELRERKDRMRTG